MHRVLAFTFALLVTLSALALDPRRALTQSRITVWTSDSGLPQNTVDAIVQTRDGYLWMGTEEGLVRFDGVRFVVSDRQTAPALRSSFISSLFESPDGTLWIGTYGGGLARMRNGRIEAFHPEVLGTDRIREMHLTADGALFVATAGGGLLRILGDNVTRYTTRDGLPIDRIWMVEDDGAGGLWVATHGGGVVRWRDGHAVQRLSTKEGLPNDFARTLLRDKDGTLWIGTDGGGLAVWRNGAIERVITTNDGLPSNLIRSLRRDRDGSLWIGTDSGLARWRDTRAEVLTVAEGLPSPLVRAIAEDREGSLWVGTIGGVVRLTDTRFLSYTRKEGMPVDAARALLESRDGTVWAGTEGGGLCRILPAPVQCMNTASGLPHDVVYALAESNDGSVWIGTDGGGVVRLRDGKLVDALDAKRGLPSDRVRAIVEAPDGTVWISTTAGLARVHAGTMTHVAQLDDRQLRPLLLLRDGSLLVGTDGAGLWRVDANGASATQIAAAGKGLESDRIFSLAADAEGKGVWIGTSGGGLSHLELASGALHSLLRRDGLHDDVVFQVVDAEKDLWLTSNRGLYRVARDRVLAAMRREPNINLSGTVYGTTDGMPSTECNGAFPGAIRTRDGRLWVSTARGVAVVDPHANFRNAIPPPVHIEEVLLDGVPATQRPLRVPPGTQRLELRYTALSLRAPERVRFRYRLDGYDRDWVDAGTSRDAHYSRLVPGSYTLRVVAVNEDGVPSNGEARLAMTVDPQWFETWWARLLALALIAAAVWGAVRLRLAALRARKNEELARAYEHVHRIAGELEDTNRQLAVANTRLRALSYLDGLTGVPNRRRFDEAVEEACASAREDGEPLSLVLIDLDHFKELNDSRGHQHGDEALRAVAALLAERTESRGGLAARFGGEEFAWLLPGVPLEEAKEEAEAFRQIIRDSAPVTASFGVSSLGPEVATPAALIAAADAALYRAKSAGRDRVA
ncbi:MAG TPA: two-component regulator propeller domain-containing protein [Thermoanaerobaculia bacterium]|nr:two-component regulator propeller domain-containing protein [Thermoanaerobaculia bacterium]